MAITEDRMLAVVDALTDALGACAKAHQLVLEAAKRVASGDAKAEDEIQQLAVMLDPQFLLEQPLTTMLAQEREKTHWTPARRKANAKRRAQRASGAAFNQGEL